LVAVYSDFARETKCVEYNLCNLISLFQHDNTSQPVSYCYRTDAWQRTGTCCKLVSFFV